MAFSLDSYLVGDCKKALDDAIKWYAAFAIIAIIVITLLFNFALGKNQ